MARIAHAPRWTLPFGIAVSTLLHLLVGVVLLADLRPPDLQLEFELPAEVEFGLTESTALVEPEPPAEPPPTVADPTGQGAEPAASVEEADAGRDGGLRDAGSTDAAPPRDAGRAADAGVEDAGPMADAAALPDGAVGSELPPGAQIAVRIDMARIRTSPIADDVRQLLDAIPDWDALLDGSGIQPVKQLDRLLLATPNLQRSRIVVAGRYQGGREQVEQAVARLAAARGVEAEWHTQNGVPVAPWANKDATPRVVALIGPSHFSISRAEDLPRLLAIAAARRKPDGGLVDAGDDGAVHPAEALLSMREGEGLSLEVEGVRRFVRRGQGIPAKLRLSASETPETEVSLRGRFVYDDEAQAEQARAFWEGARRAYARNTLVTLLGLSGPLSEGRIVREGRELILTATLNVRQTRLILGYVRELVAPPPPLPPLPPPSGAGPGSAQRPATGGAP